MRKILFGIVIALALVFGVQYCEYRKDEKEAITKSTALITQQIENVGKLIVTEGNYSQVYTYEDSKKFYFDVFSAKKKALVVVNAEATISYDLSKVETEISEINKTVTILSIPEPELKINPNIEYYDVTQDYLNQFEAKDYNTIKQRVETTLHKKVKASNLWKNAENRLLSELQKIYILTHSLGWTLQYKNGQVIDQNDFETKL